MRENRFLHFVPSDLDLDLWPSDIKFTLAVTRVQCRVSIKFEGFYRFSISSTSKWQTDRRTDGRGATFTAAP